jgi:hypothetical protein
MKANQLLALSIAAAAGCGVVNMPAPAAGDDAGGGSGSDMGSDMGSDTDPPGSHPPGTIYGHIKDERGDTIDFSSGEPVHTHAGSSVDLSTGCPAVYKYAYLTSKQAPTFGSEATLNPLAFHVQTDAASTDPTASEYRVRTDDGHTLQDWTQMAPDADSVYTMTLHRDDGLAMQALGTSVQKMYIDARFRDIGGTQTLVTGCWENHPLAAPLQVGQLTSGALFGMTFAASSPISTVLESYLAGNYGGVIATMPVVQTTAEPIALTLALPKPTGTETVAALTVDIPTSVAVASLLCGPVTYDPGCNHYFATRTPLDSSGPLAGVWNLRLVDDQTGTFICGNAGVDDGTAITEGCAIPARTDGPPRAYHLVLSLSSSNLAPIAATFYGEYTVAGKPFTGTAPTDDSGCSQFRSHTNPNTGVTTTNCTQTTTASLTTALQTAHIDLDAITLGITSNVGEPVMPIVAPASLVLGAQSWDAGNAGL